MSYHQVGLHALSNPQINKLLAGHPVRVKHGSHHTASLSAEHTKKLHRAHSKGRAITVQLDPYCCQMNEHLRGTGFFDTLKSVAKTVAPVLRPIATQVARNALGSMGPIGQTLGNLGLDIANQQAEAHGYGVKRRGRPRKHYVHHDKRLEHGRVVEPVMMGQPLHGSGFFDTLKSVAKPVSRALRPVATNFLQQQLAKSSSPLLQTVGNLGLDLANKQAEKHGYGVHKRRGRPRKHHGKALYPAGPHGGMVYM